MYIEMKQGPVVVCAIPYKVASYGLLSVHNPSSYTSHLTYLVVGLPHIPHQMENE